MKHEKLKSIMRRFVNAFLLCTLLAKQAFGKLHDPPGNNVSPKDFLSAMAMGEPGKRGLQVINFGFPDDIENGVSEGDPLESDEVEGGLNLEQCEGDCDYDIDCQGDLVCKQRDAGEPIPCCPHIGTGGKTDFCAPPTNCKLQMCESDCDYDSDCDVGMVCFQRDRDDPVPCCPHVTAKGNLDYCAPKNCDSEAPTKQPTLAPTPRPTSSTPGPTPSPGIDVDVEIPCFSKDTTVSVLGRGVVNMENLQVGDQVLTGHENPKYDTVYAHGHYQPEIEGDFIVIKTENGVSVEMTKGHLIFVHKNQHPIPAGSVSVGDRLISPSGPVTVTKLTYVTKRGLYAPLTATGTLLLNGGIWASAYPSILQDTDEFLQLADGTKLFPMHDGIHLFLAPFRLFCRSAHIVYGHGSSACQSYTEHGLPPYVATGIDIIAWIQKQHLIVQLGVAAGVLPWLGLVAFVEKLLFENLFRASLFFLAYFLWKAKKERCFNRPWLQKV